VRWSDCLGRTRDERAGLWRLFSLEYMVMMDMNDITIEQQFVPKTEDSYETWSGVDS
jgi:hypothetical protein